jgi:O-methyltransferase
VNATIQDSDVDLRRRYLDLMKQCLTRSLVVSEGRQRGRRQRVAGALMEYLAQRGLTIVSMVPGDDEAAEPPRGQLQALLQRILARRHLRIVPDEHPRAVAHGRRGTATGNGVRARFRDLDTRLAQREREFGIDQPVNAETMIGLRRLDNLEMCLTDVIARGVEGDALEAGSWRGGAAIFMRAVLAAYGDSTRRVWVADSFAGLPKPDVCRYPADRGLDYTARKDLAIGIDQVRDNFARYGLLDDQVQFVSGWFKDTLPSAPVGQLSLLRIDADLYESTLDTLTSLYPKLSVGGYCIVDDYGLFEACRQAVHDYRRRHGIAEPIRAVDWTGVYWQRER